MAYPVENPLNNVSAFVAMRGAIGLGADLRELEVPSSPDQRHNIGVVGLEPSMFYANSAFHVLFNYSNNLGYVTCSGDPTNADNWSDPQIILGQGAGGWANQCLHGYALIDGSTIYFYFVSNSDWATYVTSTSLSTPTSGWSAPSKVVDNLGVVNGNIAAIKDPQSGVYYLLQEAQIDMAGCFGRSWQCVMLSASAATGPFSVVVNPIASLMPNFVAGSASAGWIGYDAASQTYLHYFHGAPCSRSYPTNVYRARNTKGLQYDAWQIDNDGWPIATCVDIREVNQIADIFLCQGPDGQWFGIWEGVDNTNGGYANYLIVGKMDSPPKLMTTSGMAAAAPRHINRPGFEHTRPFLLQRDVALDSAGDAVNTRVGTWALDYATAGMPGNKRLYNSSAAQNDVIPFMLDRLPPGMCAVDILYQKGPAQGVVSLHLGNGSLGRYDAAELGSLLPAGYPTIDCYAASDSYGNRATIYLPSIWADADEFPHVLAFKVASKNASASAYGLGLHGFQVRALNQPPNGIGLLRPFHSAGKKLNGWQAANVTTAFQAALGPYAWMQGCLSVIPNTVNQAHAVYRAFTSLAGLPYTITALVKPNGLNYFALAVHDGAITSTHETIQVFGLTGAGSVVSSYNVAPYQTPAIFKVGDSGWYLVQMTFVLGTTSMNVSLFPLPADQSPRTNWVGDATSGMLVTRPTIYQGF